ncbi:unnamed protein product, partial [Allacma fusca]
MGNKSTKLTRANSKDPAKATTYEHEHIM